MGKKYDSEKVHEFIDKIEEATGQYKQKAGLLGNAYDRYVENDTHVGLAADASKKFLSDKQTGFHMDQIDIHRKLVRLYFDIDELFESIVDPSALARIDTDVLEEIKDTFQKYKIPFDTKSVEIEEKARELQSKYGQYGSFTQPSYHWARSVCNDFCGDGEFLDRVVKSFEEFDQDSCAFVDNSGLEQLVDEYTGDVTKTAAVLDEAQVYDPQINDVFVDIIAVGASDALKNLRADWLDTSFNLFDGHKGILTPMAEIRWLVDKLEKLQDGFLIRSFAAFESSDNSIIKKMTSSQFYTFYKRLVEENIIDAFYYEDPIRHGMQIPAQLFSKIGEKIGGKLREGVDVAVGAMPDDSFFYWLNPSSHFWLYEAAGAMESYVKDGSLANADKYAVDYYKRYEKGGLYCLVDMVSGVFSLPELVADTYGNKQDAVCGAKNYLLHNGVKKLPQDLVIWAGDNAKQMGALWNYVQEQFIENFTNEDGTLDVGQCFESAGYLTVFIASFLVGAGETKTASTAGEAGGKAANVTSKVAKLTESPLDELARITETPLDETAKAVGEITNASKEAGTVVELENATKAESALKIEEIADETKTVVETEKVVKETETVVRAENTVNTAENVSKVPTIEADVKNPSGSVDRVRTGGAYKDVPANGGQVHHMPADSVSPYSKNKGPGIRMDTVDHMQTESWGRSKTAQKYRARQKELIDEGFFRKAQQMDIEDVRLKFGSKYDEAIQQMLEYTEELLEGLLE